MFLGECSVGKTSILQRFVKDKFTHKREKTINTDYMNKDLVIENKIIRLQIWDTAGQEQYRALTGITVKAAIGIILVYDVTSKKTFERIPE